MTRYDFLSSELESPEELDAIEANKALKYFR